MKPELSYTRINTFNTCRMKYYWEYDQDLTPKIKANALVVGDIVHRLLDTYYRGEYIPTSVDELADTVKKLFPNNPDEDINKTSLEAATLFSGYVSEYKDTTLKIISPEVHVRKEFDDFILYSRYDAICVLPGGQRMRFETKTAGRMDTNYLNGLYGGLQTGIAHWLAEELFDEPLKGTVYNIIVKTKVPQYKQNPIFNDPFQIELTKKVVYGVVEEMQKNHIYPSGRCFDYNRECDFLPLCKNDTPRLREELFESRKEVKRKAQEIGFKLWDDVLSYEETATNINL